jgi:hypothetical protein
MAPPEPSPDIQRQAAPEIPLPLDVLSEERPVASQTQTDMAPRNISQPVDSVQSLMPEATPSVQRQTDPEIGTPLPYDVPSDALPADRAPAPSPTQLTVPSPVQPSVQRQAEFTAPVPTPETTVSAPTALPFDDLDTAALQRTQVQKAVPPAQPSALPFDPVVPEQAHSIQRTPATEPADPFSMPDTMPAGVPADSRMDVFQALVAAGMVSRPPGGTTAIPARATPAQPLAQRSPSREAYLASMAQQQESAGSVSGPIQRALSIEAESNPPAPETESEETPEIDVDKLASDVMRVLRGKLRSEHERLSKR